MMIQNYNLTDVTSLARNFTNQPVRIWILEGTLGAGKTTLVQAMLKEWGVQGPVQSPTYSYVSIYRLADKTIYHFDLYRLTSADDFIQAGFDEYLYDEHAVVLIEWPEIVRSLLPKPVCTLSIAYKSATERCLEMQILE